MFIKFSPLRGFMNLIRMILIIKSGRNIVRNHICCVMFTCIYTFVYGFRKLSPVKLFWRQSKLWLSNLCSQLKCQSSMLKRYADEIFKKKILGEFYCPLMALKFVPTSKFHDIKWKFIMLTRYMKVEKIVFFKLKKLNFYVMYK